MGVMLMDIVATGPTDRMHATPYEAHVAADEARPWPLAVSLGAHGLLVVAAWLLISPVGLEVATPPSIPVEFVSAAQFEAAATREALANERVPAPPQAPITVPPAATPGPMTTATTLLTGQILGDPANAGLRRALTTVERGERIIQLCNIEGLAQFQLVRPGTVPDALVTYAFGDVTVTGLTLDAPAGAFRSEGNWYAVALTCTVGADLESVTDFEFRIGEAIPESEWAAHNLLATDDDLDGDE